MPCRRLGPATSSWARVAPAAPNCGGRRRHWHAADSLEQESDVPTRQDGANPLETYPQSLCARHQSLPALRCRQCAMWGIPHGLGRQRRRGLAWRWKAGGGCHRCRDPARGVRGTTTTRNHCWRAPPGVHATRAGSHRVLPPNSCRCGAYGAVQCGAWAQKSERHVDGPGWAGEVCRLRAEVSTERPLGWDRRFPLTTESKITPKRATAV